MEDPAWFDEIDLDPDGTWLRMGTRQLGARPWLVFDRHRDDELALKAELVRTRHHEVFGVEAGSAAVAPGAERAGIEVLGLVTAALLEAGLPVTDPGRAVDGLAGAGADRPHPLDVAGRLVQEDLCLLRPADRGWVLAAASLCFPSRWRLAEKLGRPLDAVHGPVAGYRQVLARRVDTMLDRLGEALVWRRNWFVHPDPALFQPDRPEHGDPVVVADRCGRDLHLRSERQTLRTLPDSGWVLFTIRIQQVDLRHFLADPDRRAAFAHFVERAPEEIATHRGLSPPQLGELRIALTDPGPPSRLFGDRSDR